jgi:hypothetical protein
MLPPLRCWNTSCSRGRGGNLHDAISPEAAWLKRTLALPVICKNLPVSRRPFAALLLACAPGSGGAAVVQAPQRSSPHISASRRSMAKRDRRGKTSMSKVRNSMSTQNATTSGDHTSVYPSTLRHRDGVGRATRTTTRPAQATCAHDWTSSALHTKPPHGHALPNAPHPPPQRSHLLPR